MTEILVSSTVLILALAALRLLLRGRISPRLQYALWLLVALRLLLPGTLMKSPVSVMNSLKDKGSIWISTYRPVSSVARSPDSIQALEPVM